jgi:FMN-dependent NADH-azoreductase
MVCVTSRGGDYSAGGPMAALDFQEPYLRTIFGFIGITDLAFVSLQSTDIPPLRQAGFDTAVRVAREVACSPAWSGAALSTAVAS